MKTNYSKIIRRQIESVNDSLVEKIQNSKGTGIVSIPKIGMNPIHPRKGINFYIPNGYVLVDLNDGSPSCIIRKKR